VRTVDCVVCGLEISRPLGQHYGLFRAGPAAPVLMRYLSKTSRAAHVRLMSGRQTAAQWG
jgi:hypothetical protein